MSTTTTLTTEQIEEAKKQEQIIDNGLSSYVEIGFALRKIQDEKLHEGKFIDYAMDRFALKSHTIYRLMRAADVAKNLIDVGLPSPKNAGQAHRIYELFKDDPTEQVKLWEKVIESGVPAALSQIDRFANAGQKINAPTDEDDSESVGEVDMESVHHVEPISIPPSDADPLPCLRRAAQELKAVKNAIEDGFDDFEPLEDEIEQIAKLIEGIRSKLGAVTLAA